MTPGEWPKNLRSDETQTQKIIKVEIDWFILAPVLVTIKIISNFGHTPLFRNLLLMKPKHFLI